MKILLLSESGYGAWFAHLFIKEGHTVHYHCLPKYENVLMGIAPPLTRSPLKPSAYDMIVFDMTGNGREAENYALYAPVIGDSLLADRLEDDRIFGLQTMQDCGINLPKWKGFNNLNDARLYIRETNGRYVYKPSGDDNDVSTTYVSRSADDLLAYLDILSQDSKSSEFVLQEVVEGVEISTEGYFNGEEWFFINCTLEEKKFMNDGLGPNTGCSGNVIWCYDTPPRIFTEGLGKLTPFLKMHGYRGMVDLNTIVHEGSLYGLEFTPRFGYDATATQLQLLGQPYSTFLFDIVTGKRPQPTWKSGCFAASTRLSIPPYPYEDKKQVYEEGIPIEGIDLEKLEKWYIYDVQVREGGKKDKDGESLLETCGASGFIGCPISTGEGITHAFENVKDMLKGVRIPNVQYRTDISKTTAKRYDQLYRWGWLRS